MITCHLIQHCAHNFQSGISSTSLSSIGELFDEGEIVPDEREWFSGSEKGLEDSDLAFQKG